MSAPKGAPPARNAASEKQARTAHPGLPLPIFATSIAILLVTTLSWSRRWAYSGAAIESLLILYGHANGSRIFPFADLWPLLATFNLIYAVCSTSWLLFGTFTILCYPFIFVTCLWQFSFVASLARKTLRKWLRQLHFTRDKMALFNLPALEIDVDVEGLLVVRGITLSVSRLTLVAHGVELGIKLSNEIELAISVDTVTVALFRHIHIGEVYANLKGEVEMTFANLGAREETTIGGERIFEKDTPLLRAATLGATEFESRRPKAQRSHTRTSFTKDVPAKDALDDVTVLSPEDRDAEARYYEMLNEIQQTSAVGQSRHKAKFSSEGEDGTMPDDAGNARMAIVAEIQELTSIPHPPSQSIRVTTIQKLTPPAVREFLHRLPLLLRLLLSPLSYLHPITVSCVTAGVSGSWIAAILGQQVFKHYSDTSSEVSRLEEKVSAWLADANFSVQLLNFDALAQVPLGTTSDIYVRGTINEIAAYRSVLGVAESDKVMRLGGADGSVNIPPYLLPHHEHIVPGKPIPKAENATSTSDQKDLEAAPMSESTPPDSTKIGYNAHASLPAKLDQSLLGFVAALVKATKVIELEKDFHDEESVDVDVAEIPTPTSPSSLTSTELDTDQSETIAPLSPSKRTDSIKTFARSMRQNLKDNTAGHSMKAFAKDLNQSARDSMRKAMVVGVVNDSWIAKVVGKIAAKLETAQGSFGYSGTIPIPLEPYRGADELPSKLLS